MSKSGSETTIAKGVSIQELSTRENQNMSNPTKMSSARDCPSSGASNGVYDNTQAYDETTFSVLTQHESADDSETVESKDLLSNTGRNKVDSPDSIKSESKKVFSVINRRVSKT